MGAPPEERHLIYLATHQKWPGPLRSRFVALIIGFVTSSAVCLRGRFPAPSQLPHSASTRSRVHIQCPCRKRLRPVGKASGFCGFPTSVLPNWAGDWHPPQSLGSEPEACRTPVGHAWWGTITGCPARQVLYRGRWQAFRPRGAGSRSPREGTLRRPLVSVKNEPRVRENSATVACGGIGRMVRLRARPA